MDQRIVRGFVAMLCAATPIPCAAQTHTFPSHGIHIIVPFPAGGTVDTVIRMLGQQVARNVHQPVIVENKPGAGTVIGVDSVAKAVPDGYTLVAVGTSFAVNATLVGALPYDTLKDLRPISLLSRTPNVLVGNPAVPANTLPELIAFARAHPGKITYGSIGNGTIQHVAAESLKALAHVDMVHIPYKGTPPALADLLGGQIDVMFGNLPELLSHIRSGKLKAFGVAASQRLALAPEIPTIAEQGFAGFESYGWFGLMAPAGVPPAVMFLLNREVVRALKTAEVSQSLRAIGLEPTPSTAQEFDRYLHAEVLKYGDVIRKLGMKID